MMFGVQTLLVIRGADFHQQPRGFILHPRRLLHHHSFSFRRFLCGRRAISSLTKHCHLTRLQHVDV